MLLLILYVLVALCFSFFCSVAEAVLLSVTLPYIALLKSRKKPAADHLRQLKQEIDKPLAAILTLNTIAHTVGAAGAGAQAAEVFGSAYVGIASAVLTLLILVFSEIIPKTLGAYYWRQLAPLTAYSLKALVWLLRPLIWLTELLTRSLTRGRRRSAINRLELLALTELGRQEGALAAKESVIMQNVLRLRETPVSAAMTPRPVVFAVPAELTVAEYFASFGEKPFSRIPIYAREPEEIVGFVLRSDLLLARVKEELVAKVGDYRREIMTIPEQVDLSRALDRFLKERAQIMLVVDEYGGLAGILTLEDVLETLLGIEIIDEGDTSEDMQRLARQLWEQRARDMGLDIEVFSPPAQRDVPRE